MARKKASAGNSLKVFTALQEHGPMTSREIAEETGLSANTVSTLVYKLKRAPRVIYIASYVEQSWDGLGVRPCPRYAVGKLRDASKPAPLTRGEADKRYREWQKKRVPSVFSIGDMDVSILFQQG